MSKRAYEKIRAGLVEALAIARGEADPSTYRIHVPDEVDVKAIRKKFGMTQNAFAERFGFSMARLRDWEQGRSHPDGALRAYLLVIDRKPDAVKEALGAVQKSRRLASQKRRGRTSGARATAA